MRERTGHNPPCTDGHCTICIGDGGERGMMWYIIAVLTGILIFPLLSSTVGDWLFIGTIAFWVFFFVSAE